ncbi:MAG TPA: deoxyribonuclease IV [Acidobacteriota bacterium]|nr:deoxyribonuclease IV [Acidobacteriota bacterium]
MNQPAAQRSMPQKKTKGPLIGAHMSIAGGTFNAILHAEEAGCACVQLFVKSSNQWRAKPLTDEEVERFRAERRRTAIGPALAHSSYLINIASPDDALYQQSRAALLEEYQRCDRLGIEYLVFHPGAHKGSGVDAGIARIARAMDWVFHETPEAAPMLLLETTAGAGTHIGSTFEELRAILDALNAAERAAVCLDTCHVFAAGYDIRTAETYKKTMARFDEVLGLNRLKAIHCNDSKYDFDTHKDRHDHLGQGFIGEAAFGFLMRDPKLIRIPKILETPKDEAGENDQRNLGLLRELAAT